MIGDSLNVAGIPVIQGVRMSTIPNLSPCGESENPASRSSVNIGVCLQLVDYSLLLA